MSRRRLTETDEKLLSLLEANARKPVVALAKQVGLSRTAVQARLERLEDEGVIAGYTIVRGHAPLRVGIRSFFLVTLSKTTVLHKLRDYPGVVAAWTVASSQMDAMLLVETIDTEALGDFRIKLEDTCGVTAVTTVPILHTARQCAFGSALSANSMSLS